jgi:hypothetical protein
VGTKRAIYAGAAIGIAPVAALTAIAAAPSVAQAATHSPASSHSPRTKTVSLHGLGRAAVPATSCAGVTQTTTHQPPASLTYWYTNAGCVGTVDGSLSQARNQSSVPTGYRVRIWDSGVLEYSRTVGVTAHTQSNFTNFTAGDAVRTLFPFPAEVCGAWMTGSTAKNIICHTD